MNTTESQRIAEALRRVAVKLELEWQESRADVPLNLCDLTGIMVMLADEIDPEFESRE